jgi:hypothetical protein
VFLKLECGYLVQVLNSDTPGLQFAVVADTRFLVGGVNARFSHESP